MSTSGDAIKRQLGDSSEDVAQLRMAHASALQQLEAERARSQAALASVSGQAHLVSGGQGLTISTRICLQCLSPGCSVENPFFNYCFPCFPPCP